MSRSTALRLRTEVVRQFSCTDASPCRTARETPVVNQYQSTPRNCSAPDASTALTCSVTLRTAAGLWSMLATCEMVPAASCAIRAVHSRAYTEDAASSVCASSWK
eukprot:3604458-Prymnesium_polylepis.2